MQCKFCSRDISNKGSLVAHEKTCKSNPDRIPKLRSPDAGRRKGCVPWNKGKTNPDSYKVWREKYPDEIVFVADSKFARHALKRRILKDNLIPHLCAICGIGPEWNDRPMPLILDHINGVNNDNRIENLRFVCSNCDSQLETYKARNKRKTVGD